MLSPLEWLARALDRCTPSGRGRLATPHYDRSFTGRERFKHAVSLDMETLKAIAQQTGGQAFRATDQNSLVEIYAEIDALERTEYRGRWKNTDDGPLVLGLGLMVGLLARLFGALLWPEVAS